MEALTGIAAAVPQGRGGRRREHPEWVRWVSFLRSSGGVDLRQLDEAVQRSARCRISLCEILVTDGILTEEELVHTLGASLQLPALGYGAPDVDRQVLRTLPRSLSIDHSLIPLHRSNGFKSAAGCDRSRDS
jgi:Type II secretion system (T2SS), protein E, N-terminal domain